MTVKEGSFIEKIEREILHPVEHEQLISTDRT